MSTYSIKGVPFLQLEVCREHSRERLMSVSARGPEVRAPLFSILRGWPLIEWSASLRGIASLLREWVALWDEALSCYNVDGGILPSKRERLRELQSVSGEWPAAMKRVEGPPRFALPVSTPGLRVGDHVHVHGQYEFVPDPYNRNIGMRRESRPPQLVSVSAIDFDGCLAYVAVDGRDAGSLDLTDGMVSFVGRHPWQDRE